MKHSRWLLGPALVVVAVLASVAGATAADRLEPLNVMLNVSDSAEVPRDVLQRAEQEMTAIYRRIGVNAVWSDRFSRAAEPMSSLAPTQGAILHLLVMIPSPTATEQMAGRGDVFGFAPRNRPEVAGRVAYVFYHRAQVLAQSETVDVATLFAHVLAHEIGHLLLPFGSHSRTGIMRGQWDLAQLRAAERGTLAFTHDQATLIRGFVSAAAQVRSERAPSVAPSLGPAPAPRSRLSR
jgi:hypothetical protein